MAEDVVEFGKPARPVDPDGRLDAAAFHRNHRAIWSVLWPFLCGKTGDVLELGSGTGQHVVAFARESPDVTWWPSDLKDAHLASIAAWRAASGLANIRAPLRIDLSAPDWSQTRDTGDGYGPLLAIFCANVIHIAPWRVAEGLFAGAAQRLRPDGRLFLYGPFKRDGRHTSPSNADFDASLRKADPEWGVRDIDQLMSLAAQGGLCLADVVDMPANNFILTFARISDPAPRA